MLLPSGWYAICGSNEISDKKPRSFRRFGRELVTWRDAHGSPVVSHDRCPHRAAKLSLGKIKGGHIVCPYHGFEFDTQGACRLIPELDREAPQIRLNTFKTFESHGWVWVWHGLDKDVTTDPRYFSQLNPSFTTSQFKISWKTHLTRVIENQLDYSHLPHVHKIKFGKFANRKQPPLYQLESDRLLVLFNEADPTSSFIDFLMPNIWHICFARSYSLVIAFVPVDDHNTDIYLRSYQNFVKIPVLRSIVAALLSLKNRHFLAQDHSIATSQYPHNSAEAQNEKLIGSDRAISHFRQEWKRQTENLLKPALTEQKVVE